MVVRFNSSRKQLRAKKPSKTTDPISVSTVFPSLVVTSKSSINLSLEEPPFLQNVVDPLASPRLSNSHPNPSLTSPHLFSPASSFSVSVKDSPFLSFLSTAPSTSSFRLPSLLVSGPIDFPTFSDDEDSINSITLDNQPYIPDEFLNSIKKNNLFYSSDFVVNNGLISSRKMAPLKS
ncbi:hypothetical protein RCL1_005925 [Eukaryota sp. TZLM3-RCL]